MIIGNKTFDTKHHGYIMGILNVTPDSFSDGGKYDHLDAALKHAEEMIKDGAAIIDVGGESTRHGYTLISDEEEIGKPVGSDEKNHKTTYVTLKGLEQSAKDVEEISKKAIEILARYDVGDRYLTNLTRFLIHRTH